MMAHVPLFTLGGKARRVLIIGGGDGGVLREVLKHRSVEKAVLVDIDRTVVDLSREYLPEISQGALDDPRAEVIIADGVDFVAQTDQRFDAIIVDSTEPIGPAAVLFTQRFFAGCRRCLNETGVLVTQSGLPFLFPDHLRDTLGLLGGLFADAAPYLVDQPTYFGGPFALAFAATTSDARAVSREDIAHAYILASFKTRYYTPDMHIASFVLPAYIAEIASKS
jgi:spermidine synthase